jgi:hypothetical protein
MATTLWAICEAKEKNANIGQARRQPAEELHRLGWGL